MPEVVRPAPAKVNLALSVGDAEPPQRDGAPNPRAGWHPLASWMVCIDLADTVTVRPGPGPHRVVWAADAVRPTTIDWPIEKDLAVRALRALEQEVGRPLACSLTVEKRIPVGGGLGGGSSDAGALLLAAREAFGLPLTDAQLGAVGARVGSDVAFFTDGARRPGVVTGFGETVERTPAVPGTVTLVLPPFGCSTPAVYRAFDALDRPMSMVMRPEHDRVRMLAAGPLDARLWFNDLEPAAEAVEPGLAAVRRAAGAATGARAMVTGSGSTVIVDGDHASKLRAAAEKDVWAGGPLAGCAVVPARFM